MGHKTIPCSADVKARIDDVKREGETYNGVLIRLIESHQESINSDQAREIANEQIAERVVPEAQR